MMKLSLAFLFLFFSCMSNSGGKINLSELKIMVKKEASKTLCPQLDLKSVEYLNNLFAENGRESKFLNIVNDSFEKDESMALIYSENGEIQTGHLYLFDVKKGVVKHYVQEYDKLIEVKSFLRDNLNFPNFYHNYKYICSEIPSEISGSYLISNENGLHIKIVSGKSIYDDLMAR